MTKDMTCCHSSKMLKKDFDNIDNFLDVISEKNRLHILCLLRDGEKCVCDIHESIGLSQNLASHHLRVLKEFGLIKSRREGRKILYTTNKKNMNQYINLLNNFLTKNI